MMSIGEFARAVDLSISAVRFYADRHLLTPTATDPATGYRYYDEGQIPLGSTIRDLRLMEMSLSQIEGVLRMDPFDRDAAIKTHIEHLDARLAEVHNVARTFSSAVETGHACTLTSADLAQAIIQVAAAAGNDPRHPHRMCVLVEVRDNSLRLAATDNYRLAVRDLVVSTDGPPFSAVVAAAEIRRWPEVLADLGKIMLEVSDGILTARGHETVLQCPTLPVVFPDYERVLAPSTATTTALVARRHELVSLLGSFDGDASVSLTASDGVLVAARDGNERRITVEVDGDDAQLAINPRFASDAVEHAVGIEVVVEIDDALRPITFRSADDGTYTSLLMPVALG